MSCPGSQWVSVVNGIHAVLQQVRNPLQLGDKGRALVSVQAHVEQEALALVRGQHVDDRFAPFGGGLNQQLRGASPTMSATVAHRDAIAMASSGLLPHSIATAWATLQARAEGEGLGSTPNSAAATSDRVRCLVMAYRPGVTP